jgi:amino acid adenylation domain-containing protein
VTQTREKALGAYSHQDLPFEQLVAELAPERTSSHSPLFQVMFILNNADAASQAANVIGLKQLETATSKFDLTFYVSEGENGLRVLIEYSTDLFEAATIQRMGAHYGGLLDAISHDPDRSLAMLSMLPESERQQLLIDWNRTAVVYPESSLCLHELIETQVRKVPDQVALVVEQQQITYSMLNQRANQLAHHLQELGVGPNVLVGLCVERSVEMVVGVLGILKAGGAYVPLDPSFPDERLAYMMEDSGMRVLVTHRDCHKKLPAQNCSVVNLDSEWDCIATKSAENLSRTDGSSGDLAYVLYTSGSTGKPKGVEIQHSAFVNFLLSMREVPGFTATDTMLAVTTLSFDIAGLEIYLPLITGGTVEVASLVDTQDPSRLSELIRRSCCSVMQATPATWWSLIHSGWGGAPHLKVLCGGEPLTEELEKELLSRCSELWNMYGPTETTVWSTIHRVTSADGPAPIGRPIANTQIFVLDVNRNVTPVGVIGELHIGGLGLARGYLGRSMLTQERFISSPFAKSERLYRTGDLVRWRPDGTLECLGRVDNQVKVRGFRIELGEVEAVLSRHEAVRQCAAAAYERTSGNKVLVAYFEPKLGFSPAVGDLRMYLMKELPDYMVPSIFIAMDKLPLTANGKINRKALTIPSEQTIEVQGEFVAPRDHIEQVLAHLWAKVLRVTRVGLKDNFFDLGGHSLLAVRIVVEIEKLFQKRLPLASLLQAPTVGDLAEVLRSKNWKPSWSLLVPLRPGGSRQPLFLMHAHGGNVLEYYQLANCLEEGQPVYALQARGLDGNIVRGDSLEMMAAAYLKELRSLQSKGPYFLGGFCFGGLLALEVAQQLRSVGEEVALLVLIQTMPPATDRFRLEVGLFRRWWYRATIRIGIERERLFSGEKSYFQERYRQALDLLWARSALAYDSFVGKSTAQRTAQSLAYILESLRMEHDKIAEVYDPRPYDGDVLLIRASKLLRGLVADPIYLGWKDVLGGNVEVCELPGHQQTLLLEPQVSRLAKELTARLKTVQEQREVANERLAS